MIEGTLPGVRLASYEFALAGALSNRTPTIMVIGGIIMGACNRRGGARTYRSFRG